MKVLCFFLSPVHRGEYNVDTYPFQLQAHHNATVILKEYIFTSSHCYQVMLNFFSTPLA